MPEREPPDPEEKLYTSEVLEDEDGRPYRIRQQVVGRENDIGGGEWPDPSTPPRAPAPGAVHAEPDAPAGADDRVAEDHPDGHVRPDR
jgi:hypothetical protein